MLSLRPASIALVFAAFVAAASAAAELPVLEDFPTDNANWTGRARSPRPCRDRG